MFTGRRTRRPLVVAPSRVPEVAKEILAFLRTQSISAFGRVQGIFNNEKYSYVLKLSQDYQVINDNRIHTNGRFFIVTIKYEQDDVSYENMGSNINKTTATEIMANSWIDRMITWILQHFPQEADAQMDSTDATEQGMENLESEKHINTIMTRDVPLAASIQPQQWPQGILVKMTTGQETPKFPVWQRRMIPLARGTLATSNVASSILTSWIFPRDLYTNVTTPVEAPFRQFVFTRPNIHLKFKINAQKFATGRYMLSYYYEPLTAYASQTLSSTAINSVANAIMRDHVLIDLGDSNEGELNIPFRNKAPWTTTLTNTINTYQGAANVIVQLHCVVPMRVGDDTPQTCDWTLFAAAPGTEFSGMRYGIVPADAQMGNAYTTFKDTTRDLFAGLKSIPVAGSLFSAAGSVIGNTSLAIGRPFAKPETVAQVEKDLKYIGIIKNRDKPSNFHEPVEYRPNPGGNTAVGTNIAESAYAMKLDPTSTTIVLPEHDMEADIASVKDFLRIFTLRNQSTFVYPMDATPGTELFSINAMPGWEMSATDSYPPLDFWSQYYHYYSGDWEIRFDFIANQFQTGIVLVSYVPYHDDYNYTQAQSAYWTIFDLREQRSFVFKVPYINNTVVRMLRGVSNTPGVGIQVPSPGSIKMFVVNQMNPINNAPNAITVNVFTRACDNFEFSYPKPSTTGPWGRILWTQLQYGQPSGFSIGTDLADAQMDDGSKETLDNIPKFGDTLGGACCLQTNEDHMLIQNLMRRWTHYANLTLPADQPYRIDMPLLLWSTSNTRGSVRTIQAAIQRQFRYYRGGLKFMIIFEGYDDDTTIYVTHIPQSNALNSSAGPLFTGGNADDPLLVYMGYATQIIIPRINPVAKFDIPWHGVYDYMDCQYAVGSTPSAVIDRVGTNLGHLSIVSNSTPSVNMRVLIAMADDGQFIQPIYLTRINGVVNSNGIATFIDVNPDEEADAQMPIDEEDNHFIWCPLQIWSAGYPARIREMFPEECWCDQAESYSPAWLAGETDMERFNNILRAHRQIVDAQSPDEVNDPLLQGQTGPTDETLAPAPRTQGFCSSVYRRITNSMVNAVTTTTDVISAAGQLPSVVNQLNVVGTKAENILEYIKDAAHSITNSIKQSFSWLTNIGAVFSAVLHFLQCIVNRTWQSFVISLSGILISIGCFASDFATKFLDFFMNLVPQSAQNHRTAEQVADAQCPHDECSQCGSVCHPRCELCRRIQSEALFDDTTLGHLVALIFGSVAAFFGYKGESPDVSMFKKMFNFSKTFWLTIYQSGRFLSSMVTLIRKCFQWISRRSPLSSGAIELTEQPDSVKSFIHEASLMTDERNLHELESSPHLKWRFWYCVSAAHQMLVKFTGSELPIANSIIRLANKVIDRGNKIAIQSMACPVRYEPFVLSVEGPTNIGKSYMLQETMPKLLAEAYKIRTFAPPVHVRSPGLEFWNTYTNQPCVLYDDFLAVKSPELAAKQVAEIYNLKSSAQFNLNMAHLEEKKLLGNPFLVVLACNSAFTVIGGTASPEAFLRRKEHSWRVTLKEQYRNLRSVPPEVKENFGMYEFQRYDDPADPQSLNSHVYSFEQWYEIVKVDANMYHRQEKKNVARRLESLKRLLPETARNMMHEVDPFRIFYSAYTSAADEPGLIQNGLLPSQLIDTMLNDLICVTSNGNVTIVEPPVGYLVQRNEVHGRTGLVPDRWLEHPVVGEATPMICSVHPRQTPRRDHPGCECLMELTVRSPADGQIWRPRMPAAVKEWFEGIMYMEHPDRASAEQFFESNPLLHIREGECPVCNTEKELVSGCPSGHAICSDCEHGIRRASIESDVPYSCPVCRATIIRLRENPENLRRQLRFLYYAKKTGQTLTQGYQKVRDYFAHNPYARRALVLAFVLAYVSGMSFAVAHTQLPGIRFTDAIQNSWNDDDDWYATSWIKRWFIFFYVHRQYLTKAAHQNIVYGQMPDAESEVFEEANDEDADDDEVEQTHIPGPSWLGPRHVKLKRIIDTIKPVKNTIRDSCPHKRLMRLPRGDVYAACVDGHFGWSVGIMGTEVVHDQPCQYEDCEWKDYKARARYINTWIPEHLTDIETEFRRYEQFHGVFQLPEDLLTSEASTVVNAEHRQIITAINQYRGKTWYEFAGDLWLRFGRFVKVAAAIASGIMAFVGAYKLLHHFAPNQIDAATQRVGQIVNSGANVTRRIARKTFVPRRLMEVDAQISPDREERAVGLIERNTCFLVCRIKDTEDSTWKVKRLRAIGIFGRTLLMPGHFGKFIISKLAMLRKGDIVGLTVTLERFMQRECRVEVPLTPQMFVFGQNDFCYMTTPPSFPMFKDLTNQIPTQAMHSQIGGSYVHIECEATQQMITAREGEIRGMLDRQRIRGTVHYDSYEIFDAYVTSYGKNGSCGSILITDSNSPLFAMHVAGHLADPTNSTGYAIPLIREDIIDLRNDEAVLSYWLPDILQEAADSQMYLSGAILPVASVKKNLVAYMPTETKIIPSLLQNKLETEDGKPIPVNTQPGILSAKDPRYEHDNSPLYHGCQKHTRPPLEFNNIILEQCVEQLKEEINFKVKPLRCVSEEMTIEQAVAGFNDKEYYDAIDLSTSTGWPWNTGVKKVKRDYITITRNKHSTVESVKINDDLLTTMEQNDDLRASGTRPFTVFLDWLKDERRKQKKLQLKDGTRIFSLSPVDLTIQLRQRYLDFAAAFMKSRDDLEHAVGIAVDGPEWSRLANKLLNKSHLIVTGDYSDFGPRLASQIVRAAFDIMISWYIHNGLRDERIIRIMKVMVEEVANSYHIMHDFIYQTMCGSPSGCALTVIINSLCNMLYIRYVYFTIFPDHNISQYKENVLLKVYGDDLIMAVRPTIIDYFNCQTISSVLAEYDIKFTDAAKAGTIRYQALEDASFLKCGFLRHPTKDMHWLAPLEEQSIHECAQWVWKSSDIQAATIENAEASLRLAYGHGPDFFATWRKIINRGLYNLRLPGCSLTWNFIDSQFFPTEVYSGTYVCTRPNKSVGLKAGDDGEPMGKRRGVILRLKQHYPSDGEVLITKGLSAEEEEEEEESDMPVVMTNRPSGSELEISE